MWEAKTAVDESVWTDGYARLVIGSYTRRPLPRSNQRIGSTEVSWHQPLSGWYHVHALGGTVDDRRLARAIVAGQLDAYGLRQLSFTVGGPTLRKTADWNEVQEKAIRLMNDGSVQILRNAPDVIVGHVIGDHGDYQTEISRQDPNSNVIDHWTCECPWDQFAWQRTRQWKNMEGRPCAHVLATHWYAQGMPMDQEFDPTTGQPTAAPGGQIGLPMSVPALRPPGGMAPPGMPGASPPAPSQQLSIPGIAPGTMDATPPMPPGAGILPMPPMPPAPPPVSVPGAKVPDPSNPLQYPGGTFSATMKDYAGEANTIEGSDVEAHRDSGWPLDLDGIDSQSSTGQGSVWESDLSGEAMVGSPGNIHGTGGRNSRGNDARSSMQNHSVCESILYESNDGQEEYASWRWTDSNQRSQNPLSMRSGANSTRQSGNPSQMLGMPSRVHQIEDASAQGEVEGRAVRPGGTFSKAANMGDAEWDFDIDDGQMDGYKFVWNGEKGIVHDVAKDGMTYHHWLSEAIDSAGASGDIGGSITPEGIIDIAYGNVENRPAAQKWLEDQGFKMPANSQERAYADRHGYKIAAAGDTFENSDMVRINQDEYGVASGGAKGKGHGEWRTIKRNSVGEVLGQDKTTGWVDVAFPINTSGPLEPHIIRAWIEPANLTPMPGISKPGPFIRRKR